MKYLYGDSTDSGLDLNYLAFLKDAIDCAVVLVENEAVLEGTIEGRRVREREAAAAIAAVEELGKSAAQLAQPVAKEHADKPVGRAAASIVTAAREAIERETGQVKSTLATELGAIDKKDRRLRDACRDVLDKLLRSHDLPDAEKIFEITWTGSSVKAVMRQYTKFGVEATIDLEIPPNTVFGADLRVDRIVEGIEVNALEAAGWLKKSDKLVPHKLGRYHIVGVTVGKDTVVRIRVSAEANAAGFDIKQLRDGSMSIERSGGDSGRDVTVDDRSKPALKTLVEKLETMARALGDKRTGLSAFQIDNKPLAEYSHPRVLAERLIAAMAPVVQRIAKHSHSAGELVLRVPVGNDRREEIFVTTAELVKRYDRLPAAGKALFAPLQLGGLDASGAPAAVSVTAVTAPSMPVAAPTRRSPTQPPPPPPGVRSKTPSEVTQLPAAPASAPAKVSIPSPTATRSKLPSTAPVVPMPDRSLTPAAASGRIPAVPATVVAETTEPDKKSTESIAAKAESIAASIDAALGEDEDDSPFAK